MNYKYGNYTDRPISLNIKGRRIFLKPNCENFVLGDAPTLDAFTAIGIKRLPDDAQGGIADAKLKGEEDIKTPDVLEKTETETPQPTEPINSGNTSLEIPSVEAEVIVEEHVEEASTQHESVEIEWKGIKLAQLRSLAEEHNIDLGGKKNYMVIKKIIKDALS